METDVIRGSAAIGLDAGWRPLPITHRLARAALYTTELLFVTAWVAFFARPFLDLDPTLFPAYHEFIPSIQPYHVWTRALQCGWCALWQGNIGGGYPAFIDPLGNVLNPLVIVATLGWGVASGSKLVVAGALLIAGLAQWWLGLVLRLGTVARVWTSGLAVVGGYLLPRVETGPTLVLSAAMCMLVLPPLLIFGRSASRRAAVLLGGALGIAALSGPGYMQIGLLFCLPAALILWRGGRACLGLYIRRTALAAIVAVLIGAPFWVPFLHFAPEIYKENDVSFKNAQTFLYVPLNLVINDRDFYGTNALDKSVYRWFHVNYIGVPAVSLAVFGLVVAFIRRDAREPLFLFALAFLALWLSSAMPLRAVTALGSSDTSPIIKAITGIRNPGPIATLAVPPILALAGLGIQTLWSSTWLRRLVSPTAVGRPSRRWVALLPRLAPWILVVPLGLSLNEVRLFTSDWLSLSRLPAYVPAVLQAIRTPDLQWVSTPFADRFYVESAVAAGLKMPRDFYRTWSWNTREPPDPVLEAAKNQNQPLTPMQFVNRVDGDVSIFAAVPGREYAAVTGPTGARTICDAHGIGGSIVASCETPDGGLLVVKENNWSGWEARLDGQRGLELRPGTWLSVDLPPGRHTIEISYRPWDVPLGLALFGMGLAVIVVMLRWTTATTSRIRR